MKTAIAVFSLILFYCKTFCQDFDLKWSSTFTRSWSVKIGYNKNYLFTVLGKRDSYKFDLVKFDYNLQQVSETEFEIDDKNLWPLSVISTANSAFFIFTSLKEKNEKEEVYSLDIDENGNIAASPRLLGSISSKKNMGYTINTDDRGFRFSEDRKSVAYIMSSRVKEDKNLEEFTIIFFDANLNKQWERLIQLPYADNDLEIERIVVLNSGEVYFTTKLKKEMDDREKGMPKYDYRLFVIDEREITEYPVSLNDDLAVLQMGIFPVEGNEIIGGGYYTKAGYSPSDRQVFFQRIDKATKEIVLLKLDKSSSFFPESELNHFETLDNGKTFCMVSQQQTIVNMGETSSYHYESFGVYKFSLDGDVLLSEIISNYYSYKTGYLCEVMDGNLHLVFPKDQNRLENHVDIVEIDESTISRKSAFNSPSLFFKSGYSFKMNDSKILLYREQIKGVTTDYQLGILRFN